MLEIRCSSLARAMQCPGFYQLNDKHYSPTNEAAKIGTAAGELLEAMLIQKTVKPLVKLQASNGIYFDDEMRYHLEPFAQQLFDTYGFDYRCEQRIDWVSESGVKIRGQYDICFETENTLHIYDLKYGYGIVDVLNNWQLIGYAIGEVIRLGKAFENIEFAIFQPRPKHEDGSLRTWTISYNNLIEYKNKIESQLKKITMGLKELVSGKSCRYCPASHNCPVTTRMMYEGIDLTLTDFNQDVLTDEEISKQLDLLERVNEVFKIKKDSLEQLSISRIKKGSIIPGYMLEEKYGRRYWKKNLLPETLETLTGMKLTEETLMSPSKCEKLGVNKDLVNHFTERWSTGGKLVRKSASELGDKIFGKQK